MNLMHAEVKVTMCIKISAGCDYLKKQFQHER